MNSSVMASPSPRVTPEIRITLLVMYLSFVSVKLAQRACVPLSPWERARREGNWHGEALFHDSGRRFAMPVRMVSAKQMAISGTGLPGFPETFSIAFKDLIIRQKRH
jgi:hypothetical protein